MASRKHWSPGHEVKLGKDPLAPWILPAGLTLILAILISILKELAS